MIWMSLLIFFGLKLLEDNYKNNRSFRVCTLSHSITIHNFCPTNRKYDSDNANAQM